MSVITSLLLLLLVTRGERGRTTTEQLLFVYFSTIYLDQPVYSCVRLFYFFHLSPSLHPATPAFYLKLTIILTKETEVITLKKKGL
jgi:hypothetical protein